MVIEDPLAELQQTIQNIEISYDYDGVYQELYDAVTDYCNEEQDWDLQSECFDTSDGCNCIVDYDYAENEARYILQDEGGLVRLYYFMGDCNFNDNLFYLNGYGNLQQLDIHDLGNLKDHILECIEAKMEEEGSSIRRSYDDEDEE